MVKRTVTAAPAATDPGANAPAAPVDTKFLDKLAKQLTTVQNAITGNKALVQASAKSRGLWAEYGRICAEAREVLKSNKSFGAWLIDNGLDTFCDRNTRSDAIWLHTMPEDFLLDVVPAESNNPRHIRVFYRNSVKAILDKLAEGAAVKGTDDFESVQSDVLNDTEKRFVGVLPTNVWEQEVTAYKNKAPAATFAGAAVEEAARALIAKIMKHPQPADVAAALVAMIAEQNARPVPWSADPDPVEPSTSEPVEPSASEPVASEPEEDEPQATIAAE